MKALKIVLVLLIVYVAVVVAFESMLGHFQPQGGPTILITTTDENGEPHQRVVSRLISDGAVYVAANHWPRAWYHQALDNPIVQVTTDGETVTYRAVPVTGAEQQRVNDENRRGIGFLLLTGFPPRYFLRLEPQTSEPESAPE